MMDLLQYALEPLRKDEVFVLYRARRRDGAKVDPPSLLLLAPASTHPAPESLKRIEREYSLRDDLDPAWAVRPLALSPRDGQTMLVLEDPGGEPLDRFVQGPMELTQFLRLAAELSTAVGQLHARGLIHKDIKPSNVFFNAVTGGVWLMGFGIGTRLARERQTPESPALIAGTLAYMAPEQTGRMNRSIDSRSDLYALGVTLYEMLTGRLPFMASDAMEWVHCHIAKQPAPPDERRSGVPAPVSAIVLKLLAKTAEERYQTAAGLSYDLRRCLADFEAFGRIDPFPVGTRDTSNQLLIPETLYGREREIDTLVTAFDRVVSTAVPELVLVSGYSGIGKSSVVHELHKVLVPPRGLFASGKFDQYKRDIPYATLAQALQTLIRKLLGQSEAELGPWRDAFREALGPNGLLVVNLIPEIELVIGKQPPVPELPPQDAQRRFQMVFRRLIGVFARPEHPLALFLDDLQWLDAATLDLLEQLATSADMRYLLLVGAYRDNEVGPAHPLMRTLDAIRKSGAKVQEIGLAALALGDVGRLVADTLHCQSARAQPLARLVHERTGGNPFFVIQFVTTLADEGLVAFDPVAQAWRWEMDRIRAKSYTDNVVELMAAKLRRLSHATQQALEELACLGSVVEITNLTVLLGKSEEEIHAALWEATRAGLILRQGHSYAFLHDRVQEAAYALIPEDARAAAHLRIGRLLVSRTRPDELEEKIFEIVNQLNRGAGLIESPVEREQVAELDLIAGTRAKVSTAYASALTYLTAGEALLPEDSWQRRHELTFALERHRAECEYLTGAPAEAERRLTMIATHAATGVEEATVACLRVDLYALDRNDRAIAVGLDYLRNQGIDWSPHPTEEEARQEYEQIWSRIGDRPIEALVDLPVMTDPGCLATLDVLTKLVVPALIADANLGALVVCKAINLSIERGNCDRSCFVYEYLGMISGERFGDPHAASRAYRFGLLGCELVARPGLNRFESGTYVAFASLVNLWARHVKTGRDFLRRGFERGNRVGDLTNAAVSCPNLVTNLLASGDPLDEVQREAEHGVAFAQQAGFGVVMDIIAAQLGLIRTLRGLTPTFGTFDDGQLEERQVERRFAGNPNLVIAECLYWIYKLHARVLAGNSAAALEAATRAQPLLWTLSACFETADYHFYAALAHAASYDAAGAGGGQQHRDAVAAHHQQLQYWAANCPDNFENRAALVGAEVARLEGREVEAERLYEQAIHSARASGFVQNEALANELAARFYEARGFAKIARAYLQDARYGYLRWGAAGKVRQLDQLYPRLREEEPGSGPTSTIGAPVEHLDLATVIKVSQAVSGEVVLEKLIETLMRTAIEHAGAERGLLILPRGAELQIQAEATISGDTVIVRLREADAAALPESIVRYVVRTHESVLLDDALAVHPFAADEYIRQHRARSMLCLPLMNQTRLIGVLYLENNLTAHVFTPTRITVLKLLASQAAISLENTRLYADLEVREAKIRRLVDANIIGIFTWNRDGLITDANEAFLQMVGYARDDLVSGRMSQVVLTPPEWFDRDAQAVVELKVTGTVQSYEKEFVRTDGSRVPVLIGGASFDGTGDEGVAFVLDLTERKRADEERDRLRRVEADLARMDRVTTLGELAASLAHEITQPIAAAVTNARTCARWLQRDRPDLAEASEAASRTVSAAMRAGDILDRVRSLYTRGTLRRELVHVNEVVREMIALLQPEASRRGVVIRTAAAEHLPAIVADRVQIQQVLMNLILNGIEAMAEAPGDLVIAADCTDDQELLISVSDSGVGLPADQPDRIFDAFFTTKPRGSGMGLSISRTIVESHGGRLWASVNPTRGATFHFTLPGEHTLPSPSSV